MHANVGDHIVVRGHHVGDTDRRGEIVEAVGPTVHRRMWCGGQTVARASSILAPTQPWSMRAQARESRAG